MTNDPASIAALLRSLIVYTVCAVLAIILGVLMTNPLSSYATVGTIAFLCVLPLLPVLLKWHHPLMILSWGLPISMFFIKGSPRLILVMITLSLVISITERALNQPRFIKVPQVTWPLLFLIGVIAITAKLNGGIGFKAFGSDVTGGKKYVFLIVGILGYFALTSRPIPPEKARLYVAMYFLGGTLGFVGDLYPFVPGFLHPIYWIIPPTIYDTGTGDLGTTRLVGTGWAATAVVNVLIALYGIRGIFLSGKLWRPVVFFVACFLIFVGGFRSALILTGATFMLQFFLEGMHRTKLMPFFIIFVLAFAAAVLPMASRLPFTFQRTLAFLPSSVIHLSTDARLAAEASTDWRLDMWKALLPQVPKHLLLGKGYAISMEDAQAMGTDSAFQSIDAGQQSLALSSDYHSGPLSVILPFGIWGVFGFLWFIIASNKVMYQNFRYGPPELQTINTFLFTTYVIATVDFFFLFGDFSGGMANFVGFLGLSICVNRGVHRRPVAVTQNIPFNMKFANARRRPQPAFQNRLSDSRFV
jgi:hypothetical protein